MTKDRVWGRFRFNVCFLIYLRIPSFVISRSAIAIGIVRLQVVQYGGGVCSRASADHGVMRDPCVF